MGGPNLEALAQVLEADARIGAAIVFGSQATGRSRAASDVDIALIPASFEAAESLRSELLTLLGRATLAAGADVQLIDLPRAGATLRRQVFRDGKVLFDRHPARTTELLERTMREYVDEFHYRRIYEEALAQRFPAGGPGATDG